MKMILKIFNFVKPILDKQIPMFSQTVAEFGKSKSNNVAMVVVMFAISILTNDITNVIGHVYLLIGIAVFVLKDAIAKINGFRHGKN